MVKYLALAMALVGSLVVVDLAEAGKHHRRGGGGCQGGNCYAAPVGCANGACAEGVPYDGAPPATGGAPLAPEATSAPVAPAAVTVTVAPAAQPTQYISTGYRRGLFGRRR